MYSVNMIFQLLQQNEIPDAVPSSGDQPQEEVIENGMTSPVNIYSYLT